MDLSHKGMTMSDAHSLIEGQMITELPTSADVVIIGGGIVGAATAFWLAKAERRPHASGCYRRKPRCRR